MTIPSTNGRVKVSYLLSHVDPSNQMKVTRSSNRIQTGGVILNLMAYFHTRLLESYKDQWPRRPNGTLRLRRLLRCAILPHSPPSQPSKTKVVAVNMVKLSVLLPHSPPSHPSKKVAATTVESVVFYIRNMASRRDLWAVKL